MGRMSSTEWYRSRANEIVKDLDSPDREIIVEASEAILVNYKGGAWVQCWLWVADPAEPEEEGE